MLNYEQYKVKGVLMNKSFSFERIIKIYDKLLSK